MLPCSDTLQTNFMRFIIKTFRYVLLLIVFSYSWVAMGQHLTISSSGEGSTGNITSGTNWSINTFTHTLTVTGTLTSANIHPNVITSYLANAGSLTIILPWQGIDANIPRFIYINNNITYSGNRTATLQFFSGNSIVLASGISIVSTSFPMHLALNSRYNVDYTVNGGLPDYGNIAFTNNTITTMGTFSPFAIGDVATSLPVTWLTISATKQPTAVELNWATATEQNTKDFEVQYSTNTLEWSALGTIMAAGNSAAARNYTFIHHSPLKGNYYNYYRILQRDLDGKFSYSKIVSIIYNEPGADIVIYPNPVKDVINIYLAESQQIKLVNMSGVSVWKGQLTAGRNQLPVTHLPKGIYLLLTNYGTKRIIIQ